MWRVLSLVICWSAPLLAQDTAPQSGWRGNQTGRWPEATPVLEWGLNPRSALTGLRSAPTLPTDKGHGDALLVRKGLLRSWLIVGPFAVADSRKDFDTDLLNGEATIQPKVGMKSGPHTWQAHDAPADDITVFGTAEMPFLDLGKVFTFAPNRIAYAHTYVYSPRGGPVRFVLEHGEGLKIWVNGNEVYRATTHVFGLGFYTSISRAELAQQENPSPQFTATLTPGWNRLLLKMSSPNADGHKHLRCCLRIYEGQPITYDRNNIVWQTALPGRSTSTPLLVGEHLFVLAEPDELLCIDKASGRIVWSQFVNYYETVTAAEKAAQPAFAEQIDPLYQQLRTETDRTKRRVLRAKVQQALLKIDPGRFKIKADGHFEAHFGIVGFTMPTPVSDGQHIYVWNGMGVAACFTRNGQRRWLTRIEADQLSYGSSPALVDGVFVVFQQGLYGFDARTGQRLWTQKKIRTNVASLLGTQLGGKPVVLTQRGDMIRPRDGEILYRPKDSTSTGDTGWAPGVVVDATLYLPKYGVANLNVYDLADVSKLGEPTLVKSINLPSDISRGTGGKWIDRWTAGSPLVVEGMAYMVDIYQQLYVVDVKTGALVYRQNLDLDGLTHYNAVAVAASPTLMGKHIFVCDNQGTTLVLEPGRQFKQLARNKIATQLERVWPIPAQETMTYAPPIGDGKRFYLRGEAFLYCIGAR